MKALGCYYFGVSAPDASWWSLTVLYCDHQHLPAVAEVTAFSEHQHLPAVADVTVFSEHQHLPAVADELSIVGMKCSLHLILLCCPPFTGNFSERKKTLLLNNAQR